MKIAAALILIVLTSCNKKYDCICGDQTGHSVNIGSVSGTKKKANERCKDNVNKTTGYYYCGITY